MGKSLPTIDRWVKEGCPVKGQGGKGRAFEFDLPEVIAWWGKRERENAAGVETGDENQLKLRKLAAEAGKAELEFARLRGDVAPVREFERATAKIMAAIRQNIMSVPQRAVLQLLGETDETAFKQKLKAELHQALEQSSVAEVELGDDEDEDDGE